MIELVENGKAGHSRVMVCSQLLSRKLGVVRRGVWRKMGWKFVLLGGALGVSLGLCGCSEQQEAPSKTASQSVETVVEEPVVIYRFKVDQKRENPAFGSGFLPLPAAVELPSTMSKYHPKSVILVDLNARKILYEKNAYEAVPIASMTKLMTLYVAFDELEKCDCRDLSSLATVSLSSVNQNPVKLGLRAGEKISIHELFVAAMLKSANDAAWQIAEEFGDGNGAEFIEKMNRKASEIGMTKSHFVNPNGLPIYHKNSPEVSMNRASAYDMAILIEHLEEYPMILRYARSKTAVWRGQTLSNGNRLLGVVSGMDGLKTGYTQAAGHCLAFSCTRNGRHLIGIAAGFSKREDCFAYVRQLLEWGYGR